MKYALLICYDETKEAKKTPAEFGKDMQDYMAFTQEIKEKGSYRAGEPLHPTSSATTVRVTDGRIVTTDGPYAETREQMGGFYIVDCANLDEAIEIAAKIPHAKQGCIEVRPVMDFSQSAKA